MWFREDLRLRDNPALFQAANAAKDGMLAVFFFTPKLWRQKGYGQNKINFILSSIKTLSQDLAERNIPLLIRQAETPSAIKKELLSLADHYKIDAICFNHCYDRVVEKTLESQLETAFKKKNRSVFSFYDDVILTPGSVLTGQNQFYSVFTPFKKKWISIVKEKGVVVLGLPKKQKRLLCKPDSISFDQYAQPIAGIETLWPAGEKEANHRLKQFIDHDIKQYDQIRDYPAIDGTSRLSPYLAIGSISPRVCLLAALKMNTNKLTSGNKGVLTWMSELIWHDFYKHLIFGIPRLCQGKPFKLYTNKLNWSRDRKLFNCWKEGKTGFPIVDAAMRQLNATGWMHNRLRMIAASFLTKLLWIDWRLGEAYFAEKLIDYDFAANNGGWQWSASTGADSVPYFRIFNPALQQKRYDPQGDFVEQYCSEPGYQKIKPVIDYQKARQHALKQFKAHLS